MTASNAERVEKIRTLLNAAFSPTHLEISDDSHLHAGHAGAKTGMGHFSVKITAAAFIDQSLIKRHRMIYDALGSMMKTDIHALSIDAAAAED